MFCTVRFRRAASTVLLALFAAGLSAQSAPPDASLYRVFLRDGSTVLSFGEFARVSDRVVISVPLGSTAMAPDLHLLSIPAESVDWEKTDAYADSVRATRYAGTRGPDDFALLSDAVSGALAEIAMTRDPGRKVAMAAEARQNVTRWVAEHYGYRATDVARMAELFDAVVAETRSAAGLPNYELSLIANLAAPPSEPLLPAPTVRDSIEEALRAAMLAPDATERTALLRAIERQLTAAAAAGEAWTAPVHAQVAGALAVEERASRSYAELTRATLQAADRQAGLADVTGVERVIRRALGADDRLGQRRPQEMASLLAMLDARLDAARRLRLARDAWLVRVEGWQRYTAAISEPLAMMRLSRAPLDQIRRLAGPSRAQLDGLAARTARALTQLSAVAPPPGGSDVHALLKNAIQLASRAADGRRRAIASGDMAPAWEASAAASGALMLLDRAASDLQALQAAPQAPQAAPKAPR